MKTNLKTEVIETGMKLSASLDLALRQLSTQQAKAITRIVAAELRGESIDSLLEGKGKICARSTYYDRARGGWIHQPKFQLALALARAEATRQYHDEEVGDAVAELKRATLPAAKDLHRQIVGDQSAIERLAKFAGDFTKSTAERTAAILSLAEIGTQQSTVALVTLLEDLDEVLRIEAARALGRSAAGVNLQRRMADVAVLNRADKQTADKGAGASAEDMSDDDLANIAKQSNAPASGV